MALVVTRTFGEDQRLVLDERTLGAPVLVAVALVAATDQLILCEPRHISHRILTETTFLDNVSNTKGVLWDEG
jgi:hypothetical protein